MTAANMQELITQLSGTDGGLMLPVLVAAAVLTTVAGIAGLLAGEDPVALRLASGSSRAPRAAAAPVPIRRHQAPAGLRRLAPFLTPSDSGKRTAMSERLARAGYRSGAAVGIYFLT